jgi:hypothetical protein
MVSHAAAETPSAAESGAPVSASEQVCVEIDRFAKDYRKGFAVKIGSPRSDLEKCEAAKAYSDAVSKLVKSLQNNDQTCSGYDRLKRELLQDRTEAQMSRDRICTQAGVALPAPPGGKDGCRCWTPDAEQIAAVEAAIASRPLPLGSLDRYVRYYAGTISIGNRRSIRGRLVPASSEDVPGFHIVEGPMPPLQADGCVTYSEPGHGIWVRLDCAAPGTWTPTDGQIAELEETLRLHVPPGELFRPGSRPPFSRSQKDLVLQIYARYYAGVNEGDHRVIVGKLVIADFWRPAGTYIGIEAEFPHIFDGGCSVITVRYDPSSKQIWSQCNGVT